MKKFLFNLQIFKEKIIFYWRSFRKWFHNNEKAIVTCSTIFLIILYILIGREIYHNVRYNKMYNELKNKYENTYEKLCNMEIKVNIENKEHEVMLSAINRKVNILHDFLKRMYPGFDYVKKIDEALESNDPKLVEDLPIDLYNIYVDRYLIGEHGLNKYQIKIPGVIYPVLNPDKSYVTFEFGLWHPYEGRHTATDINNKEDTQVVAMADGEIYRSFYDVHGGNTIELKCKINDEWYFFRYRHIDNLLVKKGDKVKQGQVIAAIGATGNWIIGGRHLHLEVWKWNGKRWVNINLFMNGTYGYKYINKL